MKQDGIDGIGVLGFWVLGFHWGFIEVFRVFGVLGVFGVLKNPKTREFSDFMKRI